MSKWLVDSNGHIKGPFSEEEFKKFDLNLLEKAGLKEKHLVDNPYSLHINFSHMKKFLAKQMGHSPEEYHVSDAWQLLNQIINESEET